MTITKNWILAAALATGLAATPGLAAQEEEPAPAEEAAQAAESVEPITGLEFEGTLGAVDAEQRILLVTSAEGDELLFHYDDATEVVGQDSVQGLSGEGETMLRIEYRAEGSRAVAERIEAVASGGESAAPQDEAPGAPGEQPTSEDPEL